MPSTTLPSAQKIVSIWLHRSRVIPSPHAQLFLLVNGSLAVFLKYGQRLFWNKAGHESYGQSSLRQARLGERAQVHITADSRLHKRPTIFTTSPKTQDLHPPQLSHLPTPLDFTWRMEPWRPEYDNPGRAIIYIIHLP